MGMVTYSCSFVYPLLMLDWLWVLCLQGEIWLTVCSSIDLLLEKIIQCSSDGGNSCQLSDLVPRWGNGRPQDIGP
jgi:hypothetical protein